MTWNLEALATCSDEELAVLLKAADWKAFDAARDLPTLRARLARLERERGVTELHRLASETVAAGLPLFVSARHVGAIGAFALSPCGGYLATGSDTPAHDYSAGGELLIWEVASGRAVRSFQEIEGGIGWTEHDACLQWSRSGRLLGAAFNTNGVGVFDPFTEEPFTCDAYVTNGRDTPPAFCISPNEEQVLIASWGEDDAPACLVPIRAGESFDHDSSELVWLSGKPVSGEAPEDGLGCYRRVLWPSEAGYVVGHTRSLVYSLDTGTGALRYTNELHPPIAWSPDAHAFAQGYELLAVHDASTGAPHVVPMLMGAERLEFSADGKRLAMVVRAGNGFGAEPGIHVLEGSEVIASLDVSVAKQNWMFPDASVLSFSMDGTELACLNQHGALEVWHLSPVARRGIVEAPGHLDGVLFARGTLIGIGRSEVVFWDATTLVERARHRMRGPDGFAPAPRESSPFEGRLGVLPIAVETGWRWAVGTEQGEVICPPEALADFGSSASFVVAGRLAWPAAWAMGTKLTRVFDDASSVPKDVKLAERIKRDREPVGAPFTTIEVGDSPPPTSDSWERERHAQRQQVCVEHDLLSYELNALPVTCYRASPVLKSAEITHERLGELVGRVVMYSEAYRPEYVQIAVLTSVHPKYFTYRTETKGGFGSGSTEFTALAWIGPALLLE